MKESPHAIAEFYVNLNKFKIIGLFSIIHVAMTMIEILSFNPINFIYKYILSVPNVRFTPATSLSYNIPINDATHNPSNYAQLP